MTIITQYAQEAFEKLYPQVPVYQFKFQTRLSKRFSQFNANISYRHPVILLSLSSDWEDVDKSIIQGLFQTLYTKMFKKKYQPVQIQTLEMHLYETFLQKLEKIIIPKNIDPQLKLSFDKINAQFFHSMLDTPNLVWGQPTTRKLGSYTYQSDTISISSILHERDDLLDFVMYHEMLHKKFRYYKSKTGKNMHHHTEFRNAEKQFPNFMQIEKELQAFVTKKRRSKSLFEWWS